MTKQHNIEQGDKIILFDGVCNLCNGAITFVLKYEKTPHFKFTSLQSDIGKQLMAERHINPNEIDSIILIDVGNAYYVKSTAALEIAKDLKGGYALLSNLSALPQGFRDSVYDFIARNRYKWFGKKDQCMIPSPELKSRFLDNA